MSRRTIKTAFAVTLCAAVVSAGPVGAQFKVPKPNIPNPIDAAKEAAKRASDELAKREREAREAAERAAKAAEEAAQRAAAEAAKKEREVREAAQRAADEAARREREAREAAERARKAAADAAQRVADEAAKKEKAVREAGLRAFEEGSKAAAEFDKRRLQALDEVNEQAKRAGIEYGDDVKKAGAIVSNTWKMYTGQLDGLAGWLREHAQAGDIIAAGNVWNLDMGEWGHMAIVTDPQNELLYEATPEDGVHEIEWTKFAKHYVKIALYRVKGVNAEQAARVVTWVKEQNGKPYRKPMIDGTEKNKSTRMYCSQLIWIAYSRTLGIDLHESPNPIIHPDDMLRNRNMVLQAKARTW